MQSTLGTSRNNLAVRTVGCAREQRDSGEKPTRSPDTVTTSKQVAKRIRPTKPLLVASRVLVLVKVSLNA